MKNPAGVDAEIVVGMRSARLLDHQNIPAHPTKKFDLLVESLAGVDADTVFCMRLARLFDHQRI